MRCLLLLLLGVAMSGSVSAESLLEWQIARLPASLNTPRMRANLSAYLEGANADVRRGLDLVLQEDILGRQMQFRPESIPLDGRGKWPALPAVEDARGDSRVGIDLLEFRAASDLQGNLYVMYRADGIQNKKREDGAGLNIRGSGAQWVQIGFDIFDSKQIYYNIVSAEGKILRSGWIDAPFARGEVWEARIPLRAILEKENLPVPDAVTLIPFTGWTSGQDYGEGMVVSLSGRNPALELLLVLLEQGAFALQDSMSCAIALANSQLYAIADNETRALIRRDVVKHFHLYQKVLAYQKQTGTGLLSRAPVIPKIYWADRRRQLELENGQLSARAYIEFIDSIETLAFFHELVRANRFLEGGISSNAVVQRIDVWYYANAKYRSTMENLEDFHRLGWLSAADLQEARAEEKQGEYFTEYLGKRRRWDEFAWINYQRKLYQAKGVFRGDCGTATTVMMALYRMAGFAPASFQKLGANAAGTHNFPAYYNPGLLKWSFTQIQEARAEQDLYLFYAKPFWHPLAVRENGRRLEDGQWVAANWQGEKTSSANLETFTRKGMDALHFEELFASNTPHAPGLLFNSASVPQQLTDSDGDGVLDQEEMAFGTNPRLADTDGDGISDFWELDRGLSPLSPSPVQGIPLDGIVQEIPGASRVPSPAGDSKAASEIFDVAELQGKVESDRLVLAVRYHNDITANKTELHSFLIRADREDYWVQWYKQKGTVYRLVGSEYRKAGGQGLLEATLSGAEFAIPLAYFGGAKSFQIAYYAPGWFEGKEQITADVSGTISFGPVVRGNFPARVVRPEIPAAPAGSVWSSAP
jgi:hypothetical protein